MFKSAATKLAHNTTIPALAGNQELRPLQDLITAEKAVIVSLQKLSADFSKASEALRTWGLTEGDDLGDILSASATILTHFSSALSQYASHGHAIREQLKAIRTREENLDDMRRRRRNLVSKAEAADRKLSKMGPEHKNLATQTDTLNRLREEIRSLDTEIMVEDAAIGDFKRTISRSWMGLKFGGLLECCEKGVIAGEYGKLVISEIPEETTPPGLSRNPYYGHSKVERLVAEAHRYANDVRLSTVPSSTPAPRHVDQQLLQGSEYSPTSQQHQESLDNNLRQDYLPEPPGFGTERFVESMTQVPGSHQPQYSSLPRVSADQYNPHHGLDEFGSTGSASVLMDSNAGGGRFATFPVRSQTRGPDGLEQHRTGETAGEVPDSHNELPPVVSGRLSKDGPAPAYDASPENPWSNNTQFQPNEDQHPGSRSRQDSTLTADEDLLAYMSRPESDRQPPINHDRHASRHVRFGETSEIGDGPAQASPSPQDPAQTSVDSSEHVAEAVSNEQNPAGLTTEPKSRTEDVPPTEESRNLRPTRVPAPTISPDDEERALDAAAARGIGIELKSSVTGAGPPAIAESPSVTEHGLTDAPPYSAAYSQHPSSYPGQLTYPGHPQEQDYDPYREAPTQDFDRRSQNNLPHHLPPITSGPPQINLPTHSDSQDPYGYFHQSPRQESLNTQETPIHTPAYRTPPEYPTPSMVSRTNIGSTTLPTPSPNLRSPHSLSAAPFNNRSTSSLNTTSSGGGKISAAAFKRPSPRIGASSSPFTTIGGGANTGLSGGPEERLSSPYDPEHNRGQARLSDRDRRNTQELSNEDYDYINAYMNSGQSPGVDAGGQERYYHNAAPHSGQGWTGHPSGGYGDERFAKPDNAGLR